MPHKDVDRIFKFVEERTGCPVSVTPKQGMQTHASMVTATKASPVHVIFVNPAYESVANYLVAMQCRMIIIKWGGSLIYDLVERTAETTLAAREVSTHARNAGVPGDLANSYALTIVRGLLQQVNSIPTQMLAAEWCFAECPTLRSEQNLSILNEMRDLMSDENDGRRC